MAFSTKLSELFGSLDEQSPYSALDPLVKSSFSARGRNIVFGTPQRAASFHELLYLGKVYEQSPELNLYGSDAWLHVGKPHVIYISGACGSGKSSSMGVILEGLVPLSQQATVQRNAEQGCVIVIDTENQYWPVRYEIPQTGPKSAWQREQLEKWNLAANSVPSATVFIPHGSDLAVGPHSALSIRPCDLALEDWCCLLRVDRWSDDCRLVEAALSGLRGRSFEVSEMYEALLSHCDRDKIKGGATNALMERIKRLTGNDVLRSSGAVVEELAVPGACHIFMLGMLNAEMRNVVASVLARRLYEAAERAHHYSATLRAAGGNRQSDRQLPAIWLLIDNVESLGRVCGESGLPEALLSYSLRCRSANISLVLVGSSPSLPLNPLQQQVDIAICHQAAFLASSDELWRAAPTKPLTGLRVGGSKITDFGDMLRILSPGECFIADQFTSRTVLLKMRPRITSYA